MKRLYLSLCILILISSSIFAQTFDCFADNSQNSEKNQLPDRDKAQLVKTVLIEFDFLNRHIYKDEQKEIVYISTKNISPKYVPKISEIKFVLLNEREIEEKTKNGFGYFVFQKIKSDKIKTSVCFEYNYRDENYSKRNPGSSSSPFTINGILYEFHKINKKWQGKALYGYANQS